MSVHSSKDNSAGHSPAISECFLNHNYFRDDPDFTNLMRQIEDAIQIGVYPERIAQGSSGSYFAKNPEGECVGVYKPKNEEPYGPRNPKWTKWFQKVSSPCCFGRGCLLLNQGYLSEAGASLVDKKLGLNVVPKTKVVFLAAPTFNYSAADRTISESKTKIANSCPKIGRKFHRIGLPPKVGSIQMFVKGFKDAKTLLTQYDMDNAPDSIKKDFSRQFERLVCLDYVIRNTDRGSDNWLIKIEETESPIDSLETVKNTEAINKPADVNNPKATASNKSFKTTVKIAAIDNGLAFPFKHPDEWRKYPFGWLGLKQAKEPFSAEISDLLLNHLENINFVEEICDELNSLFQLDKDYDVRTCEKQMSIVRGQIFNLSKALKERKSPFDLVQMQPMTVVHSSGKTPGSKKKSKWSSYVKAQHKKEPYFSKF